MLNTSDYTLMSEERNYDTAPENGKMTSLTFLHQDDIALWVWLFFPSLANL